MIETYLNAYSGETDFCQAIMEKIMGRSRFEGISPCDPLCGKDYI
jgi:beta-N-acetylhexosaminidase